jgi:hypothetical protein
VQPMPMIATLSFMPSAILPPLLPFQALVLG